MELIQLTLQLLLYWKKEARPQHLSRLENAPLKR